MAPAFAKLFPALPLALTLLLAGCALRNSAPVRSTDQGEPVDGLCRFRERDGRYNLAELKVKEGPPEPAPALCIAGPYAGAKAVTSAKEADGTMLPPIIPAVAKSNPVAEEPVKEVPSALQLLYTQAAERYEKMPCYTVRMRRREVVANQQKPEEILDCKFRQEPYSLHFKWIGAEAKHREVVYVKGTKGNLIHTLTAAGDILLLPGGKHFPVPADSPLVLSKTRYPITEAAVGAWIVKYGRLVDGIDKKSPQAGMAKVLGTLKRPEFEGEVIAVQHRIPPGWEALLPRGGQRFWYFDANHHMPVLIITHDDTGREVEYYCLDQYRFTVPMTDDDFDPDKLWKK